jgi:hypothetical protein
MRDLTGSFQQARQVLDPNNFREFGHTGQIRVRCAQDAELIRPRNRRTRPTLETLPNKFTE